MFPGVVIAVVDEGTKIPVLDSVDKVCEAITEAQIAANVENQRRTQGPYTLFVSLNGLKAWPL